MELLHVLETLPQPSILLAAIRNDNVGEGLRRSPRRGPRRMHSFFRSARSLLGRIIGGDLKDDERLLLRSANHHV